MSAHLTLEQLDFWREMVGAARAVAERPTQENVTKLRRLGEKARKVTAPGYKIPGQLAMFCAFNVAARGYTLAMADELLRLADQVEAALEASSVPPQRRGAD